MQFCNEICIFSHFLFRTFLVHFLFVAIEVVPVCTMGLGLLVIVTIKSKILKQLIILEHVL